METAEPTAVDPGHYQRRKGRDLFDLWYASERAAIVPRANVRLFGVYVTHSGLSVPSQANFERNLAAKASSGAFAEVPALLRDGVPWDPASAPEGDVAARQDQLPRDSSGRKALACGE